MLPRPPRPPTRDALAFLDRYDRNLGLSEQARAGKREKMRAGTLDFYRATPALFVRDVTGPFANAARLSSLPAPRLTVLVDPHLGNFGTMRGPSGDAVFGINDFDQVGTGSPELDLARLAASVVLQARAHGLPVGDQQRLVEKLFAQYAATVDAVAAGREPARAWLSKDELHPAARGQVVAADEVKRKDFLGKYARNLDTTPRFKASDTLRPLPDDDAAPVVKALGGFAATLGSDAPVKRPLKVLDVAQRLGGGSSFGLPRYVALVENAEKGKAPILLELKLAPPSPLTDPNGNLPAFDGGAVVRGHAVLGGRQDPLSGAVMLEGRSFLLRELEPKRGSVDPKGLRAGELEGLVLDEARLVARAHAAQPAALGPLRRWIDGAPDAATRLAAFARAYADQVEQDYAAFTASDR